MIKQAEAHEKIRNLFTEWREKRHQAGKTATKSDTFTIFYPELQRDHAALLNFEPGPPEQYVESWLEPLMDKD